MNPRGRYPPPGMGGGGGGRGSGSGNMYPNANPSFQPRNLQQYVQRSPVNHQQHFQNQQAQQWLRRNQLASDSTIDEVEKTVQSEAVDQSLLSGHPRMWPGGH
ncbi:hypothetical protein HAX54_042005 [Datura stramonium]|uniref:Uncharacterized protein n=1 Tax=Datura stramonium TaxID=4076 RepID=A0ABS8W2S3_DATST|nr:hypothetical protein [Datura stramonium]